MNGQELFEWLDAIPKEDRKKAKCIIESIESCVEDEPLITAKYYKSSNKIYLIHK